MAAPKKTPKKAPKAPAGKTARKAAGNPGKSRAEQSAELFGNISDFARLGFRIGDGLHRAFGTLVASISRKKASVEPGYRYRVDGNFASASVVLAVRYGKSRTFRVLACFRPESDPALSLMYAPGRTVRHFPFSEEGIAELLKAARAMK